MLPPQTAERGREARVRWLLLLAGLFCPAALFLHHLLGDSLNMKPSFVWASLRTCLGAVCVDPKALVAHLVDPTECLALAWLVMLPP